MFVCNSLDSGSLTLLPDPGLGTTKQFDSSAPAPFLFAVCRPISETGAEAITQRTQGQDVAIGNRGGCIWSPQSLRVLDSSGLSVFISQNAEEHVAVCPGNWPLVIIVTFVPGHLATLGAIFCEGRVLRFGWYAVGGAAQGQCPQELGSDRSVQRVDQEVREYPRRERPGCCRPFGGQQAAVANADVRIRLSSDLRGACGAMGGQ